MSKEKHTMLNETDSSDTTRPEDDLPAVQKKNTTDEKLNRIASKAAKRAGMREQRYDREHGIFTK